jgi:hypothetical protein
MIGVRHKGSAIYQLKGLIMKYISIILFLLFSSQTVASDIDRILTEREITFNNRLVLKLYLDNNSARLINKFSNVCNTFDIAKGVIKESFKEYRKNHGLEYETMTDYYGKDSDTCQLVFEKWQYYQNFSWNACNMAKFNGDSRYIRNCDKGNNKESAFFGYLEIITAKATDKINTNKLVKVEKEQSERLSRIEARKKSLLKNKVVFNEINDKKSKSCISELEEIYNLDKSMLQSVSSTIDSVGVSLKANLIKEANKKLIAIPFDKPLILTGDDFCQKIPDYKSKYDEINQEYLGINSLYKSYKVKVQSEFSKRKQEKLAREEKFKLAQEKEGQYLTVRKAIQSPPRQRKVKTSNYVSEDIKVTPEQAALIPKLIQASGYACDTLSSAIRPSYSGNFSVYCNGYKYSYDIDDNGGNWVVKVN